MYSVSDRKVRVFAMKVMVGDVLKLMKTTVIDCDLLFFRLVLIYGFLFWGRRMELGFCH
ncbi:hypothetical protein Hanom_Chr11g01047731 [Helianthus anomalus]